MYKNKDLPPLTIHHNRDTVTITAEDLDLAITLFCHNKATGVDGLGDKRLRLILEDVTIFNKTLSAFNIWANDNYIPKYLNTVRIIGLSKDGTNPTPEVGKIRLIAIGNAVEKLYQTILLNKLNIEI